MHELMRIHLNRGFQIYRWIAAIDFLQTELKLDKTRKVNNCLKIEISVVTLLTISFNFFIVLEKSKEWSSTKYLRKLHADSLMFK